MKTVKVLSSLTLFLSISAHADFGNFICKSGKQSIRLEVQEISDITVESSTLTINGKNVGLSNISVIQSEYGVTQINAQVGRGAPKYRYQFKNLGSSECLGVYDSNQIGTAFVDVVNSMGKVASINCTCEQD